MNPLFIDVEASSLSGQGYPIEVAWLDERGAGGSHLIYPMPTWREWSSDSQAVHGIGRQKLLDFGQQAPVVARLLSEAAAGCTVFSDAPVADARWLAMLLDTAGLKKIAVSNVYDTSADACRPLFGAMPPLVAVSLSTSLMRQAEEEADAAIKTRHRAKADAWRLWYGWVRLQELVREALDGWPK